MKGILILILFYQGWNKIMKHKIIGIVICSLLIVNASAVFGISIEKVNANEEETDNYFVDPLSQKEIKYIVTNDKTENELPSGIISNTNDNWAPNPSFEIGCCIVPAGWTYSIDDKSKFHWDSIISHTGGKSIGVLNLTDTTRWSCWITTDFIPVDLVENTYEFSGWYKFIGTPTNGQYAAFILRMYDGKFEYLGDDGPLCDFSSEWKYVSESTSAYAGTIINKTKYVKLGLYQYYTQNEPNPLIEIRFDDIYFGFGNDPPNTPTITGETNGTIRTLYYYTIRTTDPEQDDLQYHIDWGDNTNTKTDFYESGEEVIVSHPWEIKDTYSVKVKAIDENYAESDWETLSIKIPCSYNIPLFQFWERFLERFPNAIPLLRHMLEH